MEPDSFQWCPLLGQDAVGTSRSPGGSLWTLGSSSVLCGWQSTGTNCLRVAVGPSACVSSKAAWVWSGTPCSVCPCLSRSWSTWTQWALPTWILLWKLMRYVVFWKHRPLYYCCRYIAWLGVRTGVMHRTYKTLPGISLFKKKNKKKTQLVFYWVLLVPSSFPRQYLLILVYT